MLAFLLFSVIGITATKTKHYTKESLIEKYGFSEDRFEEDKYHGVKCISYDSLHSHAVSEYDQLSYYIFSSEAAAKRAFDKGAGWFAKDAEVGDNYRKGWLTGVCDAHILGYEYLSGNMIIYVDLAILGCWGTKEEVENQPGPDYEYIDHIIEFINKEF